MIKNYPYNYSVCLNCSKDEVEDGGGYEKDIFSAYMFFLD
jgi:hypothetical protein